MNELRGFVRNMVDKKRFGFIRVGKDDYFFHRDDFSGKWDDLVRDFKTERLGTVLMTFTPVQSDKGPRASNVQRTYLSDSVEFNYK